MSESSGIDKSDSPPKVRLTFRVGVVGHRPHRLRREDIPSLARRLGEVLSAVKKAVGDFSATRPDLYNKEAPCLRAISPLAEGTDRYFATEALKLGYELCCPLPFHKEEFENDFKPPHSLEPDIDSVADFNNILADARARGDVRIFELDGRRSEAAEAYAAASRVVLNQSDLLVVVWDGEGENKRGGTYETLIEAIKFAVPVLWIDPRAPHQWQLITIHGDLPPRGSERCVPQSNTNLDAKLSEIVEHVLRPPQVIETNDRHLHKKPDLRAAYFAETKPQWNRFFGWKLFRDFVGTGRLRLPSLRLPQFEDAVMGDWPEVTDNDVEQWVNHRLRSHYAWADKLADLYADKYRSSFVFCYFAAAFAVLFGVLAHFTLGKVWSAAEIIAVGLIFWRVRWGNRCRWHQRWTEYRLIAELVRQLRFLIPLGGGRPFPRLPQHLSFGNPANTWMYWHLRGIDRAVGLPTAKVTHAYLTQCQNYIAEIVRGQIKFHDATAKRSVHIEHRLHVGGLVLFVATSAFAIAHWTLPRSGDHGIFSDLDIFLIAAAILPAFGAAVEAISNQAEFARIARRSAAMSGQLKQDLDRLLKYDSNARSSQVAEDALRVAQTMVDEVLDWRLVFLDRPLVTPG